MGVRTPEIIAYMIDLHGASRQSRDIAGHLIV